MTQTPSSWSPAGGDDAEQLAELGAVVGGKSGVGELATAISVLHAMEMTHWLPEAEAELAATAPPSAEMVG